MFSLSEKQTVSKIGLTQGNTLQQKLQQFKPKTMQAVLDFLHGPTFGGNKGTHDPKDRRRHPTFLLPAEPPVWGEAHKKMTYRQRIKAWNDSIVGDLNAFPYIVFVFYTLKIYAYVWLFITRLLIRTSVTLLRTTSSA